MKKYGRVLRRFLRYTGGGVLGLTALLTIAALTPRQWGNLAPSQDCRFLVYVSGGPMHTNLIVPAQTAVFDWGQRLKLTGNSAAVRYLQFGWGDRHFYLETPSWEQVNLFSALRALLLQNSAALFVKGYPDVPRFAGEDLKCVKLGQKDYLALMQFLEASFQVDSQGNPIRLRGGQVAAGEFYAATGKYSLLRTCNSWTATGLNAANVNTPVWGGLAPAVMLHVRNGCACTNP